MLSHSVESAVERDTLKQSSWVRRATLSDKEKFRDFSAATKLNVRKFPLDFFLSERKNRAHKKMSAPMSLPKTTENKKVFSSESRFTRKSETVEHNLALWLPKRGSLDRRVHRSLTGTNHATTNRRKPLWNQRHPKCSFVVTLRPKWPKWTSFLWTLWTLWTRWIRSVRKCSSHFHVFRLRALRCRRQCSRSRTRPPRRELWERQWLPKRSHRNRRANRWQNEQSTVIAESSLSTLCERTVHSLRILWAMLHKFGVLDCPKVQLNSIFLKYQGLNE